MLAIGVNDGQYALLVSGQWNASSTWHFVTISIEDAIQ